MNTTINGTPAKSDYEVEQAWYAWAAQNADDPVLCSMCPNGRPHTVGDLIYILRGGLDGLSGWDEYVAIIRRAGIEVVA